MTQEQKVEFAAITSGLTQLIAERQRIDAKFRELLAENRRLLQMLNEHLAGIRSLHNELEANADAADWWKS